MVYRWSNLDVLRAFTELKEQQGGLVPTVRELGEYLGITGPAVQRHLNVLVASGFLTRRSNQPRTLALTSSGQAQLV